MKIASKINIKTTNKKSDLIQICVIIFDCQETTNISEAFKTIKQKLETLHSEHKLILQPYVVINGPTLNSIHSSYVILGDLTYQVPTATLAVDICFQCMKVFHMKFSHVSSHVWQFLERQVYGFEVKNLYTCVATLIDKLQKL